MTRTERRLAIRTGVLGMLLTLLVTSIGHVGVLEPLERWIYDERARHFQFSLRKPTDLIVHVDVDDQSIDAIDQFPWPRTTMAAIVDEIRIAGAKVLAFDVVFDKPQEPKPLTKMTDDGRELVIGTIDHDEALGQAMREFGNVLVPASFTKDQIARSSVYESVRRILFEDVELTPQEIVHRIPPVPGMDAQELLDAVKRDAPECRTEAMRMRVARELSNPNTRREDLRRIILPKTPETISNSALLRMLDAAVNRRQAEIALRRFARPVAEDLPVLPTYDVLAPVVAVSDAAAATGFVDFIRNNDGVVRSMPLFLNYRDQLYPQEGLALACMMLGIRPNDPERVKISQHAVTLHPPNREPIEIPARTLYAAGLKKEVATMMEIPWFGGSDWPTMYARSGRDPHVLVGDIWQVCETRRSLAKNMGQLDEAIQSFMAFLAPDRVEQYAAHPPPQDDLKTRAELSKSLLAEAEKGGAIEQVRGLKPEERDAVIQTFIASEAVLRTAPVANAELADRLVRQAESLRQRLSGKAVLFGYVATAAAASDVVNTPIQAGCPGVVVHGVIFNGIMTGEMWRHAPPYMHPLLTIVIGALATLAVTLFNPWKAAIATTTMVAAYVIVNAVVLFDYGNVILGASGPIVAATFVWSSCTFMRFVVERLERARITNRFRSYVDQNLVDYIVENPEKEQEILAGQVRELTVVFSDLAGYTTISERLGRGVVPFLKEYFDVVVPIIGRHKGYVNKFMGDGIMFVFGAPLPNPNHAIDAVETILEAEHALADFNKQLKERGLPAVRMRAGVTTSELVVGDAGPRERSDYTVLGDGVNLASRLETANKFTGTENLISDRTAELLGDRFLLRPVGRLRVVGKSIPVEAFEVLCRKSECTDVHTRRVELTKAMVDAYQSSRFTQCLDAAEQLEGAFGPDKLVSLYRDWCLRQEELLGDDQFQGQIVLAEK